MKADLAYRLACEGTALLWRGDYQNAKLFLQALARRADQEKRKPRKPKEPVELVTNGNFQSLSSRQIAACTHAGHAADPV